MQQWCLFRRSVYGIMMIASVFDSITENIHYKRAFDIPIRVYHLTCLCGVPTTIRLGHLLSLRLFLEEWLLHFWCVKDRGLILSSSPKRLDVSNTNACCVDILRTLLQTENVQQLPWRTSSPGLSPMGWLLVSICQSFEELWHLVEARWG
ncbi:hypothetical protein TNCV_1895391 [Trichonephila clavipes]|nr:hypothetical protein TNCV_1895391 [Trichonephila clavipes]